jgi:hypothetical protein
MQVLKQRQFCKYSHGLIEVFQREQIQILAYWGKTKSTIKESVQTKAVFGTTPLHQSNNEAGEATPNV